MTIEFPTSRKEIDARSKTDVQATLEFSNPFLANSFLAALISANSGRNYEFYIQLEQSLKQMFPDTATGTFLQRWGSYVNITKNAATQSRGTLTANGVLDSTIDQGNFLTTQGGLQFVTTAQATIANNQVNVLSISRSGGIAFVETSDIHNFASGTIVSITGADQNEYNISAQILVTGQKTFQYPISSTPVTPATGNIFAQENSASVPVLSVGYGAENNLSSGEALKFSSQISGVNNTAYVQYDGVTGGADIESDNSYALRVKDEYRYPNTPFNPYEIETLCKTVSGVTRVFVFPITPYLGQVTVYFVRDNDANIIPSGQDVLNVKNTLLTIKPADMSENNVIVLAPDPKVVDFVFASITPDSNSMRTALKNNIIQAFIQQTNVGTDVPDELYNCAIHQTIDPVTGLQITNFQLIQPFGLINVSPGQIAVPGSINFLS